MSNSDAVEQAAQGYAPDMPKGTPSVASMDVNEYQRFRRMAFAEGARWALAAAMPTTTTEWGVHEPASHRTTAVPSRYEAEAWMGDEDAWNPGEPRTLVSREVTEWREVTP